MAIGPAGRVVVIGGQYGSGPDGHTTSGTFAEPADTRPGPDP